MTEYKKNVLALKKNRTDLFVKLQDENIKDENIEVYVGDALNQQKFLAAMKDNEIIPLASTYNPAHEAERYILQYKKEWNEVSVLLFGMGNIEVLRKILNEKEIIDKCIVYEPSICIFKKILEEYNIEDLITNTRLLILVEGINDNLLEEVLYNTLDYRSWKFFYFTSFSCYRRLFDDEYKKVKRLYERIYSDKQAELRTLSHFAEAGMINEIRAFYWMIDSKTIDSMVGKFPENLPCIIVAAGPSLEKNVDVLKQAMGKSFIICVDTALTFLLDRGIVPDMACTADPKKGDTYFTHPKLKNIPIALSTDSDYRALEMVGDVKPIYYSTTNDFCQRLYKDRGTNVEYFDGGGSVATVSFHIGIRLGFKRIIIIGQDLAFTDRKAHAGMGKATEKDLFYDMEMVEGYYGDKVLTRADFKHYIDWYNMKIPQLKDVHVINATEGGAKLKGAQQMPLQEAVNKYCKEKCNVKNIIESIPEVWESRYEKAELYGELIKKYKEFIKLREDITQGIERTEYAICLLRQKKYATWELQKIDKELDEIVKEISDFEGVLILVKRMIDVDVSLNDDLLDVEKDLKLESIRLYQKMQVYLRNMLDALDEMLPIWENVLNDINAKYHFD